MGRFQIGLRFRGSLTMHKTRLKVRNIFKKKEGTKNTAKIKL